MDRKERVTLLVAAIIQNERFSKGISLDTIIEDAYDLDERIQAYCEHEAWEYQNPFPDKVN